MARIDLDAGDGQDDLSEALRQLEKQQKKPAEGPQPAAAPADSDEAAKRRARREREEAHRRARGDIEGAVEAIRERQLAEERVAAKKKAPRRWPWIVVGAVAAVLIVVAVLSFRPEPLPPAAVSAKDAVRGFWSAVSEGHYEGATVYYPALVDKYGTRKQAGIYLARKFGEDPVTKVNVGEPESLPDSGDVRVPYEVWRRSGRPYNGEFVVRDSGSEKAEFVIVTGI
ncbi:MAG: hypothetical protein ACE149_19710 [Armatimonadota bacterium]